MYIDEYMAFCPHQVGQRAAKHFAFEWNKRESMPDAVAYTKMGCGYN